MEQQFTSYYDHIYSVKDDSMVWTLDYDKTSDFDDVSGHWHLEEHPEDPNWTRVFYACDIQLKGAVPKPVLNYLSQSALRTATGWVKKEAEKTSGAASPEAEPAASEPDIEAPPPPRSGGAPLVLSLSGAEIRALLLGRPVQKKHTLGLSKRDMKTLHSKQFLSTEEADFSSRGLDPKATIEMVQSLEPPKISLLKRSLIVFCLVVLLLDIVSAILAIINW